MLLLNSNGMDVVVSEDRASFRAIGGVLDLFVLLGPSPRDVLAQLAAVVGRPALPPFWSLGFHQSKCAPCLKALMPLPGTRDCGGGPARAAALLTAQLVPVQVCFLFTPAPSTPMQLAAVARQALLLPISSQGVRLSCRFQTSLQ